MLQDYKLVCLKASNFFFKQWFKKTMTKAFSKVSIAFTKIYKTLRYKDQTKLSKLRNNEHIFIRRYYFISVLYGSRRGHFLVY